MELGNNLITAEISFSGLLYGVSIWYGRLPHYMLSTPTAPIPSVVIAFASISLLPYWSQKVAEYFGGSILPADSMWYLAVRVTVFALCIFALKVFLNPLVAMELACIHSTVAVCSLTLEPIANHHRDRILAFQGGKNV